MNVQEHVVKTVATREQNELPKRQALNLILVYNSLFNLITAIILKF